MKRSDIIICPHFQFSSWKLQNNNYAYDCYCTLDHMIFVSEVSEKKEPSEEELSRIKKSMVEACSFDCPKIWSDLDTRLNKAEVSPFNDEFRGAYNIFDHDVFEGFHNKPPF